MLKLHCKSFIQKTYWCNITNFQRAISSKGSVGDKRLERENILTVPNLLCLTRIALSPYIAHLIIHNGDYPWALAVFGYAGITDAVRT